MAKDEAEFIDELIEKIRTVVEKNDEKTNSKCWGVNSIQFLKKYGHMERNE